MEHEKIPKGEVLTVQVVFSVAEMEFARDFEAIVDARLYHLKERIMQEYRDRRPAPPWMKQSR